MDYLDKVKADVLTTSDKRRRGALRVVEDPLDDFEREALKNKPIISPSEKRLAAASMAATIGIANFISLIREMRQGNVDRKRILAKIGSIGILSLVTSTALVQYSRLESPQDQMAEIETDY